MIYFRIGDPNDNFTHRSEIYFYVSHIVTFLISLQTTDKYFYFNKTRFYVKSALRYFEVFYKKKFIYFSHDSKSMTDYSV